MTIAFIGLGNMGAAKGLYGGAAGELHVVRRLEDETGTSLRLDGDWTPPWEQ